MSVLQGKHVSNIGRALGRAGCVLVFLLLAVPRPTMAQPLWSFQEMFDRADIVAIASPLATNDTREDTVVAADLHAIGVNTQFKIHLVLKGNKDIKNLVVHHYRHVEGKVVVMNAPEVVVFDLKHSNDVYLMFLKKESDGRFAPFSGQEDPRAAFYLLKFPRVAP